MLKRAKQYGFTNENITFQQLQLDADIKLFNKIVTPAHCLFHLLPPAKSLSISLRKERASISPATL